MKLPPVSWADITLAPNIVSLIRLPLAVLFPLLIHRPIAAFVVLAAAGLTDVIDGWLARKNGQVTALGAIIDPVADKAFALTVVITLLVRSMLPLWAVPALLAREIFELPLVLWIIAARAPARSRSAQASANVPGKLATVIQFGAVMSALIAPDMLESVLVLAAVAGVLAGISYWARALGRSSEREAPSSDLQ